MKAIVSCVALTFAVGCGGGAGVAVTMTSGNALASDVESMSTSDDDALILHVVRTEIHLDGEGGGWTTLSTSARDINLLALAGTEAEIAAGEVPEGKIHQIRLVLAEEQNATLRLAGVEIAVDVPSGEQSGMKLNISPPVTITAEQEVTFNVEIDGALERASTRAKLRPTAKVSVM